MYILRMYTIILITIIMFAIEIGIGKSIETNNIIANLIPMDIVYFYSDEYYKILIYRSIQLTNIYLLYFNIIYIYFVCINIILDDYNESIATSFDYAPVEGSVTCDDCDFKVICLKKFDEVKKR